MYTKRRQVISIVINFDYTVLTDDHGDGVKQSEFVRWLRRNGVNGKTSFLPRHPAKELTTGLVEGVKKQFNLK